MRLTRLAGTAVGAGLVAVLNAGVMFACSQSGFSELRDAAQARFGLGAGKTTLFQNTGSTYGVNF